MNYGILYIVPSWFTLTYHLTGQLAFLRENGFAVEVICENRGAPAAEREQVPHHSMSFGANDVSATASYRALREIDALLASDRFAIVNVSTKAGGLAAGLLARRRGLRGIVYVVRGMGSSYAPQCGPRSPWIPRLVERAACALATDVMFISQSNKAYYLAQGLCPERKATVLGGGSINGIDLGRFSPTDELRACARELRHRLAVPDGARVLAFVGRLCHQKGIAVLASAWKVVRDRQPEKYLMIVAPKEVEAGLEGIVDDLRTDPQVRFTGFMDRPEIAFAAADCLLLPSTQAEGFGNVAIEAAALGLPVVATTVPGCVDAVVDGVTGLLVPPRDPGALALAIDALVNDDGLRARLGAAGRELVARDYRQEIVWGHLAEKYLEILRRSPRSSSSK